MDNWRAEALKREQALEKYFDEVQRRDLEHKGYKVPTIGDYNQALFVMKRTYNDYEKVLCKTIKHAFSKDLPLHPRIIERLKMLVAKYTED